MGNGIKTSLARRRKSRRRDASRRKALNRIVEHDLIHRVSYGEYRDKVRHVYDGPKGAALIAASTLSLHVPLGARLLRERAFDVRGMKSILDVGSGAGQIAKHLLRYADPLARIHCLDLSAEMLRRARSRLRRRAPDFAVADLTRLPFADAVFDGITCGYVLEHLPDPRAGLAELARVMVPGGRMLLLTTEDNFGGAWTSRMWCCRTYNRGELRRTCHDLGLTWKRELWFTKLHKVIRAGGICVEIEKRAGEPSTAGELAR